MLENLQNPKKLKKGDLISIVSPSAGLGEMFPHRVKDGIRALERMGFKVKIEQHALNRNGWVSGTPEHRVADLHSAFEDPKVVGIMAAIGGNHSNQLLKHLDFELIKSNPKIFVGYSDISVLHYALYSEAKLRTFYGPCLISEFGEYPDVLEYTKKSFISTLVEDNQRDILPSSEWTEDFNDWFDKKNHTKERTLHPSSGYHWLKEGHAHGNILGGCIPSINHLLGTKYWINPNDSLFFIDIPEGAPGEPLDLASIDSLFADLDNNEVFRDIAGLIIGRPYRFSEYMNHKFCEIIKKYTDPYNYPILYNVNIGHCAPINTIPFGIEAEIDSSKNLFRLSESWS